MIRLFLFVLLMILFGGVGKFMVISVLLDEIFVVEMLIKVRFLLSGKVRIVLLFVLVEMVMFL